jgi:hypothetical protein
MNGCPTRLEMLLNYEPGSESRREALSSGYPHNYSTVLLLLLLLLPGLEEFPVDPSPGFTSVNATEVGTDVLLILLSIATPVIFIDSTTTKYFTTNVKVQTKEEAKWFRYRYQ